LSREIARASFSNRSRHVISTANSGTQDFDGDRTVQPGVASLEDLAHTSAPKYGLDLIRAEAGADVHGHLTGKF
jgi:hypothetical protein